MKANVTRNIAEPWKKLEGGEREKIKQRKGKVGGENDQRWCYSTLVPN
jgi:hypothetical protein